MFSKKYISSLLITGACLATMAMGQIGVLSSARAALSDEVSLTITANGAAAAAIGSTEALDVQISLNRTGGGIPVPGDWWLVYAGADGVKSLNPGSGLWEQRISPTYQGPPIGFPETTVFTQDDLPGAPGDYAILFGVDGVANGFVDTDSLVYDFVTVNVSQVDSSAFRTVLVDAGQTSCFDDRAEITCPAEGQVFFGQDAHYEGRSFRYRDNGDGTVSDLNTGLMWQRDPGEKMTLAQAGVAVASFNLAGYTDWRLPTIKELYSLMDFNGSTGMTAETSVPYLNTDYFVFNYGDESVGDRFIDAQYLSDTKYVSTTMWGAETNFGVNFADGRIKGYGTGTNPKGQTKEFFVMFVRGETGYGVNDFVDNGDGTVTDRATGLMWTQADSGAFRAGSSGDGSLSWEEALDFCEDLVHGGLVDWRLPDAKELQSIVDYKRSPATTNSAAIDPVFGATPITDEGGGKNFPFSWTSTTHMEGPNPGLQAVYVAFGEALGFMEDPPGSGSYRLMDVHGAGAQRSDPKIGDPVDYPYGFGPQGDVRRIYNYARCVRNAE